MQRRAMPGIPDRRTPSFDFACFQPPPMITRDELDVKIAHLRSVLERLGRRAVLLSCEGAMRWLTGTRHQID